ncbi:MAG: hypothetical protein RIQ94_183 [Pseudomonadota bacterium]|jgi:hypothetical protein
MGKIEEAIDKAIMVKVGAQAPRTYLGASGLGEPCDARLWYSYKHPKVVSDPRIHRIFQLGHNLENVMIDYLFDAGFTLHTLDEDGKQFGFKDGIIAGHIDGVIIVDDTPMLVEFKTFNTKRFEDFKKKGVKETNPKYYTQVQVYMGKMELEHCVFMGIDKNDCEIFIEYVDYDPIEHHWAINRGKQIGELNERPDRKYGHKSNFNCKMCDHRKECWLGVD